MLYGLPPSISCVGSACNDLIRTSVDCVEWNRADGLFDGLLID